MLPRLKMLTGLLPLLVAVATVVGSGAALGMLAANPGNVLLSGVHVLGVHVGGMTPEEAVGHLQSYAQRLETDPVHITVDGESFVVTPQAVGLRVDLLQMVAQAAAVGQQGSLVQRLQARSTMRRDVVHVPLQWTTDSDALEAWLDAVVDTWYRPAQDARFVGQIGGKATIVPAESGREVLRTEVQRRLRDTAARFTRRTFELPARQLQPAIVEDDIKAMGLVRSIGSFSTRFDPNDENRRHNLWLAAEAIDGVLLAPGETFSFNDVVGPRGAAQGYRPAPVIVAGNLVLDYGGGVCQVSTTLYNAVLHAGLRVTMRAPHSIPPSYIPLGLDAAVADGLLDFRFTNTTEGFVYIAAGIQEDRIHVELFGSGMPQPVKFETEIVEVIPPREVVTIDPSLAPGERVVDQAGRQGYRVTVTAVPTEGGAQPTVISHTQYPARDQHVRVSPE